MCPDEGLSTDVSGWEFVFGRVRAVLISRQLCSRRLLAVFVSERIWAVFLSGREFVSGYLRAVIVSGRVGWCLCLDGSLSPIIGWEIMSAIIGLCCKYVR